MFVLGLFLRAMQAELALSDGLLL